MGKIRSLYLRHFKRLAYLIAACLLSTFCASVDRGRTRATLSFDGEYGFPGDRDYGCDGEVLNTQRHHQIGGKATLRVETREWLIVQVDLGGLYGKLDRSQNIEVSHREYFIGLVGLKVGRNWKNAGFDFGGGVLFSEDGDTALVPRLEFRLGRLGQVWFETGIGPVHAPFDGRAGYAGIGTDGGWYRFHAGGALVRRLLLSPESGNLVGGSIESEGFDAGFYGLFSFEMAKGFFLNLGGVGSSAYSFQLGLGFEL